jgi:hypothetical protein
MASTSRESIDYLRAIETLSQSEEGLRKSVSEAGPGGEAYDRAPTPPQREQKGKLLKLGERAKEIVQKAVQKFPEPSDIVEQTSKKAERFQRRAGVFFKHNGVLLAGIAAGAIAVWAGREYWNKDKSQRYRKRT